MTCKEPLARVVICLNKNTLSPNAVFGDFNSPTSAQEFIDKHKVFCKLDHIMRKKHHPIYGF